MLQMLVSEEVLDLGLKIFPSKTTETTLTAKLNKKRKRPQSFLNVCRTVLKVRQRLCGYLTRGFYTLTVFVSHQYVDSGEAKCSRLTGR